MSIGKNAIPFPRVLPAEAWAALVLAAGISASLPVLLLKANISQCTIHDLIYYLEMANIPFGQIHVYTDIKQIVGNWLKIAGWQWGQKWEQNRSTWFDSARQDQTNIAPYSALQAHPTVCSYG